MTHIDKVPDNKPTSQPSVLDSIRTQRQDARAVNAKRSWRVSLLKRILPVVALLLLLALAIAPSWQFGPDSNRVSYHLSKTQSSENSHMEDATYHGQDQQGQPYVVTASSAVQQKGDNVLMTAPQGSITLKSGAWLMLKSATGAYHQQSDTLDLSGHVILYRNDGTVMTTKNAAINLRAGSATSTMPVQVSGPFGVLNAQNGFTVTGHGDQVMFHGPASLTLEQAP